MKSASRISKIARYYDAQVRIRTSFELGSGVRGESKVSGVIVSLTSYPKRINAIWQTIQSILMQTVLPEQIVLVLSLEEFPGRLDDLPPRLRKLHDCHGDIFEILYVSYNSLSYKKLIPTLESYPDRTIITIDDDVIYPREWLSFLLESHAGNPDAIAGTRGSMMRVKDGDFLPYRTWEPAPFGIEAKSIFLTGRGGILYPAGSLAAEVLDIGLAMKLCPGADDIWFKAMGLVAGSATVRSFPGVEYAANSASQREALFLSNIDMGGNDVVLKQTFDYFGLWDLLDH